MSKSISIYRNKEFLKLIKESYKIYTIANKEIHEDFQTYNFYENLSFGWKKENISSSLKNNFFSLLMTSILIKGAKQENIKEYVKIITYIRQIVTSTDNIIDKEEKGIITLKNISNPIVKNVLVLMAVQELLSDSIKVLTDDKKISKVIINSIYGVAESESNRDFDYSNKYPTSEYVFDKVHKGIGGELLELSLRVPIAIENTKTLKEYSKGLFHIGIALQGLDDFCDMKEDFQEGKLNYALAKLLEEEIKQDEVTDELLDEILSLDIYTEFSRRYLKEIIVRAKKGFKTLEELGYPLGDRETTLLLKHLFKIRGLKKLWTLVK